jgi:salicylate hydroxylase
MKKKISIAIIGSGIAGLTLANFLHKEKNLEIEIFEKDNIKNPSTSGIQISNNARIILNKINFNQFNKKNYCNIHSIKIFDYKNLNKIASLNMNFFNKKNSEYFCIERNKLISFLLNQLNKNIKIHTNKKVIEIKTEDTNQIFFQDGQMKKFDIVVACDGIFSNLRKKLSKENLSFRHAATAYRGIIKNMGKIYSEKVNLYLGKKKHLVIYPIKPKL